ncbi:hypothetical protein ACH4E8_34535 [Streptomyces sp. NPDC017979]|uniref:hypothetical protein n=1 Tax=Streptomyces sp. NPDC017979 TaxID=3365024 RepID=UPI0037BDDBB6
MSETATKNRLAARQNRAARVQESIARAVRCPRCPDITAEEGLEILARALDPKNHRWWKTSRPVQERALRLTGDPAWREQALAWIDAYWDEHGHGPTWRHFWNAPALWPQDTTGSLLNTVMRQLTANGSFDGTMTPFGLCRHTEPEPLNGLSPNRSNAR